MQINSSGSFGGQSSVFSAGTLVQRGVECTYGTTSYSTIAALGAVSSGEITIQTGISGNVRYDHVQVSETTQFSGSSVTGLTVSMGRTGTNNSEMTGAAFPLLVSSGDLNYWNARPVPPQLSNTYSIVLGFVSSGANLSALTAGSLTWEICGYAAR